MQSNLQSSLCCAVARSPAGSFGGRAGQLQWTYNITPQHDEHTWLYDHIDPNLMQQFPKAATQRYLFS